MECQLTIDYKKIQKCIAKKFLVMMLISQLLTAEKHKKSWQSKSMNWARNIMPKSDENLIVESQR